MHKTFTDAIAITRGLGIRYLWIDALCVVQGDDGDFESEAGKMADYYRDATITLAATDSVDCEGGMLYPSNLRQKFSTSRFRHWGTTGYAFLESTQTDFENDINSAPLNQRGWVLQEGIFEDGLVVLNKERIKRPFAISTRLNSRQARQGFYEDWDAIVQGYSGRLLSKAKDKTLALAGATTGFRQLLNDDPLLGLWEKDFHAGLLWRAREPSGRIEAVELESIPSWSWMGFDGPATFDTEHRRYFRSPRTTQMVIKVDFVVVGWEGKELTSRVTHTDLLVSGRLIPFSLSSPTIKDIWWDSLSRTDESMFLLVAQVPYRSGWNSKGNRIFGTKDYFLILSENSEMSAFSRVGMGAVDNGQEARGYFADQSPETFFLA
ncbi:hypothetical protein MRS44_011017 [Fusarium solani]|uniref:uncharacterized protein n=1 Tax=Fusarium solani TaxID=169388 RepID=UPI0032C3F664|nr:hypothetical protein MRS44_011017 [Fusarium solani]